MSYVEAPQWPELPRPPESTDFGLGGKSEIRAPPSVPAEGQQLTEAGSDIDDGDTDGDDKPSSIPAGGKQLMDKEPDKFCIWVVKYLQDMAGKDLDEAISSARVYDAALEQNDLHQSTLLGLLAEFESKKEVLQPQPMRPTNKQRRKSRSAMV
jgi:hypothetical protein